MSGLTEGEREALERFLAAPSYGHVDLRDIPVMQALLRRLTAPLAGGLTEAVAKLQAFKDYVHQRLDAMGVPVDPESPHKAAGCRIGGRLDFVESRLTAGVAARELYTVKEVQDAMSQGLTVEYLSASFPEDGWKPANGNRDAMACLASGGRYRALTAAAPKVGAECCVPSPGEPSFVLLGRDPQAPTLVLRWAADRERAEPDSDKPAKARAIAAQMEAWKDAHPNVGMARGKVAALQAEAGELVIGASRVYNYDGEGFGGDWFREFTLCDVTFLAPLDKQDEARHILAALARAAQGGVNERCQRVMRARGKPYPRTCYVCGLRGACVESDATVAALAPQRSEAK